MSDALTIAHARLLAAAKFALDCQMHKGSRASVCLRQAIDEVERAREREDTAFECYLERMREAGLL